MHRKFVTKKNNLFFKTIIFLLVIYLVYKIIICNIVRIKLFKSNNNFINYLVSDNYLLDVPRNNYYLDTQNYLLNINLKKPVSMVQNTIKNNDYYLNKIAYFLSEEKIVNNPIIYLYCSNCDTYFDDHSKNNLYILYILKSMLDEKNMETIILDNDLVNLKEINGLDGFDVSKIYLEEYLNKYNLKLIFDIAIGDKESININNKEYAPVSFIIGTMNDNYTLNMELAHKLSNLMDNISDIQKREGTFNQDLSNNLLLIEIGSKDSSMKEIYNSLDELSLSIKKCIGDLDE